jgi:hypothetical protein
MKLPTRSHCFDLPDPLPFEFREIDRKLYRAILRGAEARLAFERFTTGKKAINPSWLLLALGIAIDSGARPLLWHKAERWKEKWEGLRGAAKSLKWLATKIEKHLAKSDLGPAPLATVGYDRWHQHYSSSVAAYATLTNLPSLLRGCAKLIEFYCDLNREWLAETPRDPDGQSQRTVALLCWVKEKTGRCYFERVAALLNVGRRLRGQSEESGDSLSKLWRRHPELRIPF